MLSIHSGFGYGLLYLLSFTACAKLNPIALHPTETGHLAMQAAINQKPALLILDTAATGSVIDDEKLEYFGIEASQNKQKGYVPGNELSSQIDTQLVNIHSMKIGNIKVDMKQIHAHNLRNQLGKSIDGLAGQDVLVKTAALFDVANKQLLLPYNPKNTQQYLQKLIQDEYTTTQVLQHNMGFHYITLKLEGKKIRLLLDSGASDTLFDQNTLTALGLTSKDHPSATSVDQYGNPIPIQYLPAKTLDIAGKTITQDYFAFDMSGLLDVLNKEQSIPFAGLLGLKELSQLQAVLDLSGSALYLASPE